MLIRQGEYYLYPACMRLRMQDRPDRYDAPSAALARTRTNAFLATTCRLGACPAHPRERHARNSSVVRYCWSIQALRRRPPAARCAFPAAISVRSPCHRTAARFLAAACCMRRTAAAFFTQRPQISADMAAGRLAAVGLHVQDPRGPAARTHCTRGPIRVEQAFLYSPP
jgi:hypothetical protein